MLLVTGASGFLGTNFTAEAITSGRRVVGAVYRNQCVSSSVPCVAADLTDRSAAIALLREVQPAWVVNCAGFTNVDQCETDPERANALNVELPRLLAGACASAGVRLLHVSTDSVFDGSRGCYTEDDEPAPVNMYASSKLEGERAVFDAFPGALVVRTNFIGISPSRTSGLADSLATRLDAGKRVPGFVDVVFAPLLANHLAQILFAMMDSGLTGLYHAAARDACSKYDFAVMLARAIGSDATLVDRESVANAKFAARRPLDTSLSPSRLEAALGRSMPSVRDAVQGYAALYADDRSRTMHATTKG